MIELSNFGWEIGIHGDSHRSFKWINHKEILREVSKSKEIIQNITGRKVISLCPPFGDLNNEMFPIFYRLGITDIYIQKPLYNIFKDINNINIKFTNSIYALDDINSIFRKINNNKYELLKENIIHFFSQATIYYKELLFL